MFNLDVVSPVDLRRGYAGLYTMIEHEFGGEPQSGHLWVFSTGSATW